RGRPGAGGRRHPALAADPGRGLGGRDRRGRRRRLVEHELRRIHLGGGRGGPHRSLRRRGRRALPAVFLPVAALAIVAYERATPALVLVGFLMMTPITDIDLTDVEIEVPAFLTIILMPFAYSITVGMGAGFVMYVLIRMVRGKAREVHWLMYL